MNFTEHIADPAAAYRATALIIFCGIAISTAEFLASWRQYQRRGLYSWQLIRERRYLRDQRFLPILFDLPGYLIILGVRLVAVLSLAGSVLVTRALSPALLLLLLATTLIVNYRHSYGMDGSDQISSILVVVLMLYALSPGNPLVAQAGLWFLTLQACLSYFAAGMAKIFSKKWRRGSAVFEILNTFSFGSPWVSKLLKDHPFSARLASWVVVAFEVLFPLVLVTGERGLVLFLAGGLLFHLLNAFLMGLNSFVWSFSATYPAIVFCARQLA